MDVVINACTAMPRGDAGCGKGPVERSREKPQQRFANMPALADVKEELKPKQNRNKASEGAGPQDQQATPKSTQRRKRSLQDPAETAPASSVPGLPVLVRTLAGKVTVGVNAAPSSPTAAEPQRPAMDKAAGKALAAKPPLLPPSSDQQAPPVHRSPVNPSDIVKGKTVVGAKAPEVEAGQPGRMDRQAGEPTSPDVGARLVHRPPQMTPEKGAQEKESPVPSTQVLPRPVKQAQGPVTASHQANHVPPQQPRNDRPQAAGPALPATEGPSLRGQSLPTAPKPNQPFDKTPPAGERPGVNVAKTSERSLGELRPSETQSTLSERRVVASSRTAGAEIVQAAAKDAQSEISRGAPRTQSDLPILSSPEPVVSALRTPAQPPMPMSADSGAARAPTQNLGEQILDSVRASLTQGDRQVLVRLHPPELGTVLVRFREDGQHVSAMLEVARGDTRREIEHALPQVLRGLQDAGVQVRRFEVVTSELPEKDFARGQAQQDGSAQHQGSGHNRDHFTPSPQMRWSQAGPDHSRGSAESSVDASQIDSTAGRIDMLL